MIGESIQLASEDYSQVQMISAIDGAYLSLNALPAPPFPVTEMIASSKFHDEAAEATLAPASTNEGINELRNRIVEFMKCEVGIPSCELELQAA